MMKSLIKQIRNFYLRKIRYRNFIIGPGFHAGRRTNIWGKNKVVIGKNFYLGKNSIIECNVVIGDNVLVANNVGIVGKNDHDYRKIGVPVRLAPAVRDEGFAGAENMSLVEIGDDVWIGYGSTVLSGVSIARGSIIAAGSLVLENTEPYSIVGGVPAKKLGERFNKMQILEHEKLIYGV